ncbi:hypothetical protein EYF80_064421 [Liparis tanakae]|uniref:Uncharacterized protein n=1 Tax=Liparis tanakae TaxID=230148 RepID=A0A4Z2E9G5_9TELE|nr:hypothetical protein EYF80_064421 [Liparis tanakae]
MAHYVRVLQEERPPLHCVCQRGRLRDVILSQQARLSRTHAAAGRCGYQEALRNPGSQDAAAGPERIVRRFFPEDDVSSWTR